jgi:O-antigen ligase
MPIGLALVWPAVLIDFSFLIGVAPLDFGKEGRLTGDMERLDLHSIRLLGILMAAALLVVINVRQTTNYIMRFKFHVVFLLFAVGTLLWAPSLIFGLRMIAKLAGPFIFLLLILTVVSRMEQIHHIERVMLITGMLTVLVEISYWLLGYRFEGKRGLGVPGLGPAPSSAHLAILSMLAFSALLQSRSRTHLFLTVCFASAAAAGFTRNTIIGLFAGFALMLFVSSRGIPKYFLPLSGIVALPAIFLFNDSLRYRMFKGGIIPSADTILNNPSTALDHVHGSGRFEAWSNVLEQFFFADPLFGSGIGTTQHYLYTHPFLGLNAIHSEYVRILAELGICGFLLFVFALFSYFSRLWIRYKKSSDLDEKKYALAALGMILVYFIFMATDNAIDYVTSSGIFVFGMIGLAIKSHTLAEVSAETASVVRSQAVPFILSDGMNSRPPRRYPIIEME